MHYSVDWNNVQVTLDAYYQNASVADKKAIKDAVLDIDMQLASDPYVGKISLVDPTLSVLEVLPVRVRYTISENPKTVVIELLSILVNP